MGKRRSPAPAVAAPVVPPPVTPLPDPEGASVQAKIKAARDNMRSRMTSSSYGGKTGTGGTVRVVKPVATGSPNSQLGG